MSTMTIDPKNAPAPAPSSPHATSPRRRSSLVVDRRRNGPRHSANGGVAAGSIAPFVDADTVTVVLRRPVPLERRLDIIDTGRDVEVRRRRRLVATAYPGRLANSVQPAAPDFETALAARASHPLVGIRHPLSDCVVCSPHRRDGLHVTPGFVPGRADLLAAPWVVGATDSVAGQAPLWAVWAAMDCTSYPAAALRAGTLCLLGTMTARVARRPRVGEQLVVHSWMRERHGRRWETSVALTTWDGGVVARADATWIAVRHQRLHALRFRPSPGRATGVY